MFKRGIAVLLSCAFAFCLVLFGCAGDGGNNGEDAKKAFIGTWALVEIAQDGQVTSAEDLEMLKSLGLEVYVNLNEDGTASFMLFQESIEGTWEAKSATEGSLTLNGQEVGMTIEDSKLKFEQDGATLMFEKGEAREVPAASSAASESGSSASSGSASGN